MFEYLIAVQTKRDVIENPALTSYEVTTPRSTVNAKHIALQTFSIVSFHFGCSTGRLYLAFILKLIQFDCLLCI